MQTDTLKHREQSHSGRSRSPFWYLLVLGLLSSAVVAWLVAGGIVVEEHFDFSSITWTDPDGSDLAIQLIQSQPEPARQFRLSRLRWGGILNARF